MKKYLKINELLEICTVIFMCGYLLLIPIVIDSCTTNKVYAAETVSETEKIDSIGILSEQVNETYCSLVFEVDKYISSIAPDSKVSANIFVDLCDEYNVDIRLALTQGYIESHFATKGTAAKTNSIFNVGAFDGHSANMQIKNGYGYKHPDYSIEPYLKLLTTRYLVNGKSEKDLLKNFVDKSGYRYATSKEYELRLTNQWKKINDTTNIGLLYNEYKELKNKLQLL